MDGNEFRLVKTKLADYSIGSNAFNMNGNELRLVKTKADQDTTTFTRRNPERTRARS